MIYVEVPLTYAGMVNNEHQNLMHCETWASRVAQHSVWTEPYVAECRSPSHCQGGYRQHHIYPESPMPNNDEEDRRT